MLNKFPSILDQKFIIAFLIPAFVFINCLIFAFERFSSPARSISIFSEIDGFSDAAIITILSLLVSFFLLALNRELFRLLSGYGKLNPLIIFLKYQRKYYKKLLFKSVEIKDEYHALNEEQKSDFPIEKFIERGALLEELAQCFPDDERWVLSTSFGNAIRAFEVYPRVMYGIDSISSWNRLIGVIPKDYQERIESEKMMVDFWVNLLFLNCLIAVVLLTMFVIETQIQYLTFTFCSLVFAAICYFLATSAAKTWGGFIKSAYDLYLDDLQQQMGFKPRDGETKRDMWDGFSQALLIAEPKLLPRKKRE